MLVVMTILFILLNYSFVSSSEEDINQPEPEQSQQEQNPLEQQAGQFQSERRQQQESMEESPESSESDSVLQKLQKRIGNYFTADQVSWRTTAILDCSTNRGS